MRPRFIVLEGIDGSGTTTQAALVARCLEARGRTVVTTREPSRGPVGLLLREILLGQHLTPEGRPVDGPTMALLFAADRRDHLTREIEPALEAGADVISDRYVMSSLAYQAEETDRGWVRSLAHGVREPDLTVLVDVPIAVAAERRRKAGRPVERYDGDGYLARVAQNYRNLTKETSRAVIVDGAMSVSEVTAAIMAVLDRSTKAD